MSRIGRFASRPLQGERPIGSALCGQRFDRIELQLTEADFLDARVQEWIRYTVMPRIADPRSYSIAIEVTP